MINATINGTTYQDVSTLTATDGSTTAEASLAIVDSNLVGSIIKSGVSILNVLGTFTGEGGSLNYASGTISKDSSNSLPEITHNLGTKDIAFILCAIPDDDGAISVAGKYSAFTLFYFPPTIFYGDSVSVDLSSYNSTAPNPLTYDLNASGSGMACGYSIGSPSNTAESGFYATALYNGSFSITETTAQCTIKVYPANWRWYAIDLSGIAS